METLVTQTDHQFDTRQEWFHHCIAMLGSTARDMDSISQIESPKQKNPKTRGKWQYIASQSNI